jgi:hypothetical protein
LELYRKEAEIRAHIVAVKQYYAKLWKNVKKGFRKKQ